MLYKKIVAVMIIIIFAITQVRPVSAAPAYDDLSASALAMNMNVTDATIRYKKKLDSYLPNADAIVSVLNDIIMRIYNKGREMTWEECLSAIDNSEGLDAEKKIILGKTESCLGSVCRDHVPPER